jgi:hypothetical protein
MRRLPALAAAVAGLAALAAPPSRAGTAVWVQTFVSEPGTATYVDSTSTGTVAAYAGGMVVVSKDFGATWAPLGPLSEPPNGGSSETRLGLATSTRWFAENGHVVSTTTDGGTTWRALSMPRVVKPANESFEHATEIGAADGVPVATVGWWAARVRGTCPYVVHYAPVFTTRDSGAHWKRTDLPVTGDVDRIEWFDSRRAALVLAERRWSDPKTDDGTCESIGTWLATSVWTTTDGGNTWRLAMRTNEWYVTAAWASPTSLVVLGETKGVGRSYVSDDGGRTFRKPVTVYSTVGGVNGFPAMEFAGGRRGWVGAILAGVYRTDNGGSEWTHEASTVDASFYGVPDLTAASRDRAVYGGPSALWTRYGEAPAAVSSVAPAVPPAGLTFTTTIGRMTSTRTLPAYGPSSVTVRVARDA